MAEMYKEKYYFGIHDNNMNLTSFTLTKETDGDNYTDFTIEGNSGLKIQEEDLDVVLEIAINLSTFGENAEFDSVKGDTYVICKLTEEERSHFTEYAK